MDAWDTATWKIRQTYPISPWVTVAAIARNGHWLAPADWRRTVHLVETASGKEIGTLPSGDIQGLALAFSPDGKLLATAGPSQTIQIWDVAAQRLDHQLRGHKGKVTGLTFTPDGRMLASSGKDGDVLLWNLARQTGEPQIASHFKPSRRQWAAVLARRRVVATANKSSQCFSP
jgi:WD40 repeat protein